MKPQCETPQDCLRELARVMDQFGMKSLDNAISSRYVKYTGMCERTPWFPFPQKWQFAIAEVEGKPVFIGDELWNVPNKFKFVADYTKAQPGGFSIWSNIMSHEGQSGGWVSDMSWNPPRPKTVMVEMLLEDAKTIVHQGLTGVLACRKALENLK